MKELRIRKTQQRNQPHSAVPSSRLRSLSGARQAHTHLHRSDLSWPAARGRAFIILCRFCSCASCPLARLSGNSSNLHIHALIRTQSCERNPQYAPADRTLYLTQCWSPIQSCPRRILSLNPVLHSHPNPRRCRPSRALVPFGNFGRCPRKELEPKSKT